MDNYKDWIGKKISRSDIITPRLVDHLKKVGVKSNAAVESGLVQKWADNTWHDFFVDRLTIEIRNEDGEIYFDPAYVEIDIGENVVCVIYIMTSLESLKHSQKT